MLSRILTHRWTGTALPWYQRVPIRMTTCSQRWHWQSPYQKRNLLNERQKCICKSYLESQRMYSSYHCMQMVLISLKDFVNGWNMGFRYPTTQCPKERLHNNESKPVPFQSQHRNLSAVLSKDYTDNQSNSHETPTSSSCTFSHAAHPLCLMYSEDAHASITRLMPASVFNGHVNIWHQVLVHVGEQYCTKALFLEHLWHSDTLASRKDPNIITLNNVWHCVLRHMAFASNVRRIRESKHVFSSWREKTG